MVPKEKRMAKVTKKPSLATIMLPNQSYIDVKEYKRESFQHRYSLHKASNEALRECMMRNEISGSTEALQKAQAYQDMLKISCRPSNTSFRKSYRRISIAKLMPGPRPSQLLSGVPSGNSYQQQPQAVTHAGQVSPINMVPFRPSGYIDQNPRPGISPPPPPMTDDLLNQSLPWSRDDYGAGYYAGLIMQHLFAKPWEIGGHAHNFCGMCRGSTCNDIPQYYEIEPDRLARHNAIVAALIEWNKQSELKADMLHQLYRLYTIAKTRRQFQMMRRHIKLPPGIDPSIELMGPIVFPDSTKDGHVQADIGKVKVGMLGHVDVSWHKFKCPHYMFPLLPCCRMRPNKPPARPISELILDMQLHPKKQLTADPQTTRQVQPMTEILELDHFEQRLKAPLNQPLIPWLT